MNIDREKAYIEETKRRGDGCLTFMIGCGISLVVGIIIGINYEKENESTPVEKNNTIESLTATNDSIKLKIEKLDSIKDATVIEVSSLDNDSTLKLFYKLVSE